MTDQNHFDTQNTVRPKVSIIVTAYNVEAYIRECLSDIQQQTLTEIEIIVVDDGSTDQTPQIIKEIASADNRIKSIFFEKNSIGGVASAANAGIEIAEGEYIGFADGDDRYYGQMFETLYLAAKRNKSDLAMCNYKILDTRSGEISDPADFEQWQNFRNYDVLDLDLETKKKLLKFISVPWRKIYRRELLNTHNIRFPVSNHFFEDNPFHWYSIINASNITLINESLCEHRVSRTGQTMVSADRSLFGIFEHHKTIREWLNTLGLWKPFKLSLFLWLSSQISWTANRVEKQFLKEYFENASSEVSFYSPRFVRRALGRKNDIGYYNRLRMYFLSTQNEIGFLRHDDPGKNFSLLYQAYIHIRLYGYLDLFKTIPNFIGIQNFLARKRNKKGKSDNTREVVASILILEEQLRKNHASNSQFKARSGIQQKNN